ncbi:hypothetical protein L1049_018661 [Liquidambar formosana]|uniref:Uncharacterized protein n=1 Tax=Liquidambar formosana TaxID=63359 RepID=A0AAP0WMJ2_LIQFO
MSEKKRNFIILFRLELYTGISCLIAVNHVRSIETYSPQSSTDESAPHSRSREAIKFLTAVAIGACTAVLIRDNLNRDSDSPGVGHTNSSSVQPDSSPSWDSGIPGHRRVHVFRWVLVWRQSRHCRGYIITWRENSRRGRRRWIGQG